MLTVVPNSPEKHCSSPISQKQDKSVPEGNHFSNGVNQNISADDTQHYGMWTCCINSSLLLFHCVQKLRMHIDQVGASAGWGY